MWAPLRKLFAPPGVPSWLRAWLPFSELFKPLLGRTRSRGRR